MWGEMPCLSFWIWWHPVPWFIACGWADSIVSGCHIVHPAVDRVWAGETGSLLKPEVLIAEVTPLDLQAFTRCAWSSLKAACQVSLHMLFQVRNGSSCRLSARTLHRWAVAGPFLFVSVWFLWVALKKKKLFKRDAFFFSWQSCVSGVSIFHY